MTFLRQIDFCDRLRNTPETFRGAGRGKTANTFICGVHVLRAGSKVNCPYAELTTCIPETKMRLYTD